jgi:hypothetical protein
MTYAQTAIWTTQDSSQSLSSLMSQLVAERSEGSRTVIIPAIVDHRTWQRGAFMKSSQRQTSRRGNGLAAPPTYLRVSASYAKANRSYKR